MPVTTPPIAPNPGGALEPTQVVGREQVVAECWRSLQSQSVALLAPRRIGKTSVLTGLLDSLAIDIKLIKVQLQGPQWKRLLERLFEDLEEQFAGQDRLLVLMWGEVTLFIDDLLRRGHARDAMALLDSLRAARQRHMHLRMVLTGSIGFDEILRQLQRKHGYRNRPLNDVAKRFVPLLDASGSEQLSRRLLRHGGKPQHPDLVTTMVQRCEGHPFVIQLLADQLLRLPEPQAEDVEPHLHRLLSPPGDPLDLNHYIERIDRQFEGRADLARTVLDTLASTADGMTREQLLTRMQAHDRELTLSVVRQLEDDFYLRREQGKSRFMLELLREFWCADRGL